MFVTTSLRSLLLLSSAFIVAACNSSTESGYFTTLPSPAQLQFGAQTPTLLGSETWTPYTSFDVGTQPFASKSQSTVYLSNVGQLPAGIVQMWVDSSTTSANANYYTVNNQCGNSLGAKATPCPVVVTYVPNTIGSTPATLHVSYSNGNGGLAQSDLPLTGTGSNLAYLQLQQSSVVAPNDTASSNGAYTTSATFNVLYNGAALGAAGLRIDPAEGVNISSPNESSFTIDSGGTTCGAIISANCVIKVDFAPVTAATHSGNFPISYFNGAQVLSMPASISGTGLTAAVLATLSSSGYAFPNTVVSAATPQTALVNVSFAGSIPATSTLITGPSDPDFVLNMDPTVSTCLAGALNGNCVLQVTFAPAAYQAYSSSITIAYLSNGQTRTPLSIPLTGTGVHPALLSPNTTSLAFGSDPAHEGQSQNFTFTNTGGVAPTNVSAVTVSDATDYTATLNSCSSVAPSGTCTMSVGFNPHSANTLPSTFMFTYFDGRVTQTIDLSAAGTGTSALVVTGGGTIDFGNVMIGGTTLPTAKSVGIGIYGTTAGTLTQSPSQLNSPFTFPGGFPGGGTCASAIDPNVSNSCTFKVGVTTDSGFTAGTAVTQAFTLGYSGGSTSGSLSYTAQMTPQNPPVLAFGTTPAFPTISVGNTETETFTIANNSPYFATAYISTGSLSAPFTIVSNTCTGGVAINGSCSIGVKFAPTASGTFTGTLSYVYSDTISNHTISTSLSATGSAALTLSANPTTIDFGTVYVGDTVAPRTIAIQYFGAESWTPGGTVSSPFTLDFGTCGNQANCTLTIGLQTTAVVNSTSQTLSFTYTPALASGTIPITLKANIQYRQATLTLSPTSFSNTLQNSQSTQTLTLSNSGTGAASSLTVNSTLNPSNAGISISGGTCLTAGSLAAGATCTITGVFAPTTVGSASASFSVSAVSSGSATPVSTSYTLTGNGTQMIQAFAGGYQTCILDELNNAVCWGRNSSGQLGQGNTNTITTQPKQMSKIAFGSGVKVVKLAVGDSHTCAIVNTSTANGQVTCWGSNANGRLGLGSSVAGNDAPIESGTLQLVNLGTDSSNAAEVATDIAAGFEHTCVVLHSGKVKCWGGNGSGQLGIGSTTDIGASSAQMGNSLAAVNLAGATPVSIGAGAGHSCAVLSDGSTKCWGDNYFGQLGQGVATQFIGTAANDMSGLQAINLGSGLHSAATYGSSGAFTCTLLTNGTVKCFGETEYNSGSGNPFYGVLGTCWARPVYNSGAVACWTNTNLAPTSSMGYYSGDMGNDLPIVSLPSTVSQLALGSDFVCTLESDSSVRCWGANDHGQLGIGNMNNIGGGQNDMGANLASALSPAIIGSGISPTSITTGYEHACAVLSNNTVKCWGTSSENATGLAAAGVTTDTGGTSGTVPNALAVVYDGR